MALIFDFDVQNSTANYTRCWGLVHQIWTSCFLPILNDKLLLHTLSWRQQYVILWPLTLASASEWLCWLHLLWNWKPFSSATFHCSVMGRQAKTDIQYLFFVGIVVQLDIQGVWFSVDHLSVMLLTDNLVPVIHYHVSGHSLSCVQYTCN